MSAGCPLSVGSQYLYTPPWAGIDDGDMPMIVWVESVDESRSGELVITVADSEGVEFRVTEDTLETVGEEYWDDGR